MAARSTALLRERFLVDDVICIPPWNGVIDYERSDAPSRRLSLPGSSAIWKICTPCTTNGIDAQKQHERPAAYRVKTISTMSSRACRSLSKRLRFYA
jgi:hypothetical protein